MDKNTVEVGVEYVIDADAMLLIIFDGQDKQALKFDFDGALRLNQKIASVCRMMKGSKVACEAVGRVAEAEAKARQDR